MTVPPADKPAPPGLFETFLLPLAGPAALAAFHSKSNELVFFLLPLPIIVIRIYIQALQRRRAENFIATDPQRRWMRKSSALDAFAALILGLFEMTAVMAMSPTVPRGVWLFVGGLYALYVVLRMAGRFCWISAVENL